jgi:hypothetical protein
MTERRGRRRKQLLDDLKKERRYWKFKEEVLDRTLWITRFGRGYGPVVRMNTQFTNVAVGRMIKCGVPRVVHPLIYGCEWSVKAQTGFSLSKGLPVGVGELILATSPPLIELQFRGLMDFTCPYSVE